MTDIIIHEETETPVEEIVEDLTETTEAVVEDLTDTIETLTETIEEISSEPHCDIHCQELHAKIAELEERVTVTQEHIIDEKVAEIVAEDPAPEPEPEPTPEPEPIAEETIEEIPVEETMIEPPTDRTEKSGPSGVFKFFKAIGF